MTVEQSGDSILLVDGKKVSFDWKIREFLDLGEKIIVRFSVLSFAEEDPESGRNVFAYDRQGNELWRIQDAGVLANSSTLPKVEVPQGFTEMQQKEGGRIYVWAVDWRYDLDPEAGKVSNEKYDR
jgi:hypothetical protein